MFTHTPSPLYTMHYRLRGSMGIAMCEKTSDLVEDGFPYVANNVTGPLDFICKIILVRSPTDRQHYFYRFGPAVHILYLE